MSIRHLSAASLTVSSLVVVFSAYALDASPADNAQSLADSVILSGDIPEPCIITDEVCDGLDNDCDELVDEGGVCDETCVTVRRGEYGNVRDITIYPDAPNFNDDEQIMWTGNKDVRKQALVWFGLGWLPDYSCVTSATLEITQVWTEKPQNTIRIHQVLTPWNESSTFATLDSPPGPYFQTPFEASFVAVQSETKQHFVDVTDIVEDWVQGGEPNYGFLLREALLNLSQHDYYASEHANDTPYASDLRPGLEVCYIPCAP